MLKVQFSLSAKIFALMYHSGTKNLKSVMITVIFDGIGFNLFRVKVHVFKLWGVLLLPSSDHYNLIQFYFIDSAFAALLRVFCQTRVLP